MDTKFKLNFKKILTDNHYKTIYKPEMNIFFKQGVVITDYYR